MRKKLDWNLELGKEYDYSSLVFCIIDAVFSMGVHYSSARNAVDCYADYYHLSKYNMESVKQQHRISDFIKNCDTIGDFDRVATEVFQNTQRTSPINGILKTEACYLISKILKKYRIETISDFQSMSWEMEEQLKKEITVVKGQSSGIMLEYLFMLAGDENRCKPDRHLVAFVSEMLEQNYPYDKISELIYSAYDILKMTHINLTVRYLDYLIWNYQRDLSKKRNMHKKKREIL